MRVKSNGEMTRMPLTSAHFFFIQEDVFIQHKEDMSDQDFLGEFEQFVLLAIAHLGEGAYGVTIRRDIERRSGRSISIAAVYATLGRLERAGHLIALELVVYKQLPPHTLLSPWTTRPPTLPTGVPSLRP